MSFLETREGRRAAQRTSPEARDYMNDVHEGWQVVGPRHGGWLDGGFGDRCGLVSHRGILHPDEYVDKPRLVSTLERELGFTIADVRAVYCQGRPSRAKLELRARVDARMLELAEAGGNMALLARLLGYYVHNGSCSTLARAMARARQQREAA